MIQAFLKANLVMFMFYDHALVELGPNVICFTCYAEFAMGKNMRQTMIKAQEVYKILIYCTCVDDFFQYYLIINVAVGGTNGYFPDEWIYNTPKPWNNTSPTQNEDFWSKRNDWLPTWVNDDVALIVDYVQMTQY